ncbi:hypothetical protein [Sphingomonas sp.]|jgi:tetratricopeptide (TPR) repeat protein|uniref:hypothetical protein n=1 Tax=Sphingomonas sp. TaxID=28214 RepID=UPI002DE53086|nr:hypothetical protein [Sphingomonas sp.]
MSQLSIDVVTEPWLVRCWGSFAILELSGGGDARPKGRKARALIAYLAMHPGKAISRERIAGLLWAERPDEQARASLRQTLHELRDFARGELPMLRIDRETVMLDPRAAITDIDQLRRCLIAGDYTALIEAAPDPDDVLFHGLDGVDGGFDEWLQIERTRQREIMVSILADGSAGAVASGQTRVARALHARLLEFDRDAKGHPPGPQPGMDAIHPAVPVSRPPRHVAMAASAFLVLAATAGGILWLRPQAAVASAPSRETRQLHEAARTIIYQRRLAELPVARKLLEQALLQDPDYVPAMASLATVLAMGGPNAQDAAEAERLARRAVELDPRSTKAWGVLGMVLDFESREARAAIKRAAGLDSRDPEIQFWLSNVLGIEGAYADRLQALRRAAATDPRWDRASGSAALAAWEFGFEQEAEAYAARLKEADFARSFECSYAIDAARGDYARIVRETLAVRDRLDESSAADFKLGHALLTLGEVKAARLLLRLPPLMWRITSGEGPRPGELQPLLIASERDSRADALVLTALRQVLKAGRPQEIVQAYDRRVGRLAHLDNANAANSLIMTDGLQVALALRAVGRTQDADRLLARADAAVRAAMRHGEVPNWLPAAASGVWAAQGRHEEALVALEQAIERGWHYTPKTPLPDMADIPSFAGLVGNPRFERLRHQLRDHIRREAKAVRGVFI